MAKKYRTIPTEVEAVNWTGNNEKEVLDFLDGNGHIYRGCLFIRNYSGEFTANAGEYIVKQPNGEFKAVKADIFEKSWVEVAEESSENKEI